MPLCVRMVVSFLVGAFAMRRNQKRDAYSPFDGRPLLQLTPSSEEEMRAMSDELEKLECASVGDTRGPDMLAICDSDLAVGLAKMYAGKTKMLISDAGRYYRNSSGVTQRYSQRSGVGVANEFYTAWRDSADREAQLNAAVSASGGACTLYQIGTSYEGRPIMAVRIRGQGWQAGMPRVVVSFELHAREWISSMSGTYAVEQACPLAMQGAYPGVEIVMIPTANPDGLLYSETVYRFWRKNTRVNSGSSCLGVDLNRNWDPEWNVAGSTSTCSDTYRGTSPFSEPESQAVKSVIDEAPTSVHLDIHSYSEVILRPWSYTYTDHPRRAEIDALGEVMIQAVVGTNGQPWRYGGNELLYPAAGVFPDYSTQQGAFGYTYELRPATGGLNAFAPAASEILPAAQECWAGIAAAIAWAGGAPAPTPAPTPAPPPGSWSVSGTGCEIDGNCIQSLNHPSNYGNDEQCSVQLAGVALNTETFSTERNYDVLGLGGNSYSGTSGPPSGVYTGTLYWASDYSIAASGWRLCRTN